MHTHFNFTRRTPTEPQEDTDTWQFYDFFIVNDGIDRRTTMLRTGASGRQRHSRTSSASVDIHGHQAQVSTSTAPMTEDAGNAANRATKVDTDLVALGASMSALSFVPRSVKFGRGMRAGFARK
jgi:hypothetical protein